MAPAGSSSPTAAASRWASAGPACGSTGGRRCRVVFQEEGAQPLLGAVTLEIFGLGIDRVNGRLIPVDALMLEMAERRDNQPSVAKLARYDQD